VDGWFLGKNQKALKQQQDTERVIAEPIVD